MRILIRGREATENESVRDASVNSWLEEQAKQATLHLRGDIVPEEITMTVQYLLQGLPERSRKIFELAYGIGGAKKLQVPEIARRLDMPQAEVNRVLYTSIASMKNTLLETVEWFNSITADDFEPHQVH